MDSQFFRVEKKIPDFIVLSHDEVCSADVKTNQWLTNKVIPFPGLVAISGKPGSYKTFFALWIAKRVSAGLPLFDKYMEPFFADTIMSQGKIPTLFIEEENTLSLMKHRLNAFVPFDQSNLYFMIDQGFKLSDEAHRDILKQHLQRLGIKFLLLDPFTSVAGLRDENNNAEVSTIMDILRKDFVMKGITVIFIHHPSKNDTGTANNLRGAGDILGKCDVHLSLTKEDPDEHLIKVAFEKYRIDDESMVSDFRVQLISEGAGERLYFQYIGKAERQGANPKSDKREDLANFILDAMDTGTWIERKTILEKLSIDRNNMTFKRAWKQLKDDGKIIKNSEADTFLKIG